MVFLALANSETPSPRTRAMGLRFRLRGLDTADVGSPQGTDVIFFGGTRVAILVDMLSLFGPQRCA